MKIAWLRGTGHKKRVNVTVIVRLKGGLGNQIFQYAAGVALSKRLGTSVQVDSGRMFVDAQRSYALGVFSAPHVETGRIRNCALEVAAIVNRKLQRLGSPITMSHTLFTETGHAVNAAFFQIRKRPLNILDGYFQSERYFSDACPEVRHALRFPEPACATMQGWLERIRLCTSVSIHIRRGDYVSNPQANATHGVLPLSYYRSAIARIRQYDASIQCFVFSDDLEWARENLLVEGVPLHFVDGWDKTDHDDMHLMSACQHHVIANSSYSWWGAWLNDKPDKIVVAPRAWFADTSKPSCDQTPDSWVLI
jgi:hypothetical protein